MRLCKAILHALMFFVAFTGVFGAITYFTIGIPGDGGIGVVVFIICCAFAGKPTFTYGLLVWERSAK